MTGGSGILNSAILQVCYLLQNLNLIPLIGPILAQYAVTACTQFANLFSAVGH